MRPAARPLRSEPDPAILRLARALARQAAREDHEIDEAAKRDRDTEAGRDLREVLDRPAE